MAQRSAGLPGPLRDGVDYEWAVELYSTPEASTEERNVHPTSETVEPAAPTGNKWTPGSVDDKEGDFLPEEMSGARRGP